MIESTCGYLIRDKKWLMLYRNRKENDINEGKWIGVGGKKEKDETFEECMCREVKEETGLVIDNLKKRGILYFHYDDHESEVIHIYSSTEFHGEMTECSEGTLKWIEEEEVLNLPVWEGDRIFLKKMIEHPEIGFILDLYYDNYGNLTRFVEKEGQL